MKASIFAIAAATTGETIGFLTHPDPASSTWWMLGAVAILIASLRIAHMKFVPVKPCSS